MDKSCRAGFFSSWVSMHVYHWSATVFSGFHCPLCQLATSSNFSTNDIASLRNFYFFFLSLGDFQSCSCFSPSSNQIDAVCLRNGFQISVIFSFINILCSFIIYGNNSCLWWFCYSLLMISLGLHSTDLVFVL